jgi:light-regulated signal transduction histidine kinase (bacteriophytochrome)
VSPRYSKFAALGFSLALFILALAGMLGFYITNKPMTATSEASQSQAATGAVYFIPAVTSLSIILITLSFYLLRREIKQTESAQQSVFKLNEELKSCTVQLESTIKELDAFSYSISHDLRAPIRHISGFVDLLKKQPAISQDAKSARQLAFISNAAQQMGAMVDDLGSFSRLLNAEMRLEPVQLASLVREVRESLVDSYSGRSIVWSIDEKLPEVQADPSMLRSALVCLLSNSIKYTRPRSEAVIEIHYSSTPTEHVISIRDNGVGFDMEYADKLFGVFQKLHHADQFEGTGVGLATVRRIISRHGGRTWAEGKLDQGAKFLFTLPKNPVPSSSSNGWRVT